MAAHVGRVGIVLAIVLLECGTSSPPSSLYPAQNTRGATAAAPKPSAGTLARRINTFPGSWSDISGDVLCSGAWGGWRLADGQRDGLDGDECRGKRGLLAGDVCGVGGDARIARQRWPGGVGRLRGGGQGEPLDEKRKDMEWTRIMMREGRPEKEIVEGMMDLEAFPESLETKPIAFTPGMDGDGDVAGCTLSDGCAYVMPSVNRNRVLYDPVGGVDRVYRGVGLAGMAVHAPRKWPEAIPEVVGHRSWKNVTIEGIKVHKRPQAAACRVSTSTSWKFKMEQKEKKAALRGVLSKLRVKAEQAKRAEREKLQARREIKLRNRLRSEQYQIVKNPVKLAKMSKKQRGGLKRMPKGIGLASRKVGG